jgi:hypothetical protein
LVKSQRVLLHEGDEILIEGRKLTFHVT